MHIADLFEDSALVEKRRNPHVNQKVDTLTALEKYDGRKNVFVSYTMDVGVNSHTKKKDDPAPKSRFYTGVKASGADHNASGAKLGINPQSTYNTPIGIYSYPIEYVLKNRGAVEFAGNMPFLQVFQATGHFLYLANYTEEQLQKDEEKLLARYGWAKSLITRGEREAEPQIPGGMIWNITRLIAEANTKELNDSVAYDPDDDERPSYDDFDDEDEYADALSAWEEEKEKGQKTIAKEPVQWSKVLRELGYDGVLDLEGNGIIHSNEPTQAVFFTTKGLKPLELIHNINPKDKISQQDLWSNKPQLLLNLIRKGKVGDEEVIDWLRKNEYALANIGFQNLTPGIQSYIVAHPEEFLSQYNNDLIKQAYKAFPLATLIKILDKEPWRMNDIRQPSPALMKWVVRNFDKFEKFFGHIKLPPKVMLQLVQQSPTLLEYLPSDPADVPPAIQMFAAQHNPEKVTSWLRGYRWSSVKPEVIAAWFKNTFGKSQDIYRIRQNLRHFLNFEDRPAIYARRAVTACIKTMNKATARKLAMELIPVGGPVPELLKLLILARPDLADQIKAEIKAVAARRGRTVR